MYAYTQIAPVSGFRSDGKKQKHRTKRISHLICDHCSKCFEQRYHIRFKVQMFHFCSTLCANNERAIGGLIRNRVETTCQMKFGSSSPFTAETIKPKIQRALLEKYGVDNPSKSPIIHARKTATLFQNFGVKHLRHVPGGDERRRATCMLRYGFSHPMKNPDFCRKVRQTALKRKTNSWSSKIEMAFYDVICNEFGAANVQRQIIVNNWSIDFYITSTDTYVQFDGAYWHGHDVSIDDLKRMQTLQSKGILRAKMQDIEQNDWFNRTGKRLIRISDRDFKSNGLTNFLTQAMK